MTKKANLPLYFMEGIASIMVVFIHCRFPGNFGVIIETIARFAVPLFFVISGYFQFNSDKEKLKNKIKGILKIIFISMLMYSIYSLYTYNFDIHIWIKQTYNVENIFKLIFFNYTSFIISHLWFLFALLYCYITYMMVKDKKNLNKVYYISMAIIILTMIIRCIMSYFNVDLTIQKIIFRNWLFFGLPFFFMGCYIKQNQEKILSKLNNKKLVVCMILAIILCVAEKVLGKILFNAKLEYYFGNILLVFSMFLLALKNKNLQLNGIITTIGKKYSLYIYILHYLIIKILQDILQTYSIKINEYIIPIIVLVITLLLSIVIYHIKNMFNKGQYYLTNK